MPPKNRNNTSTSSPTPTPDQNEHQRQGSLFSARFNLLSSMVGGGSLSLPLAFHQTGNAFMAPLLLIITSVMAQQSILFLVASGIYSTHPRERGGEILGESVAVGADGGVADVSVISNNANAVLNVQSNIKGTASYDNVADQAFGHRARILSMGLVFACCFFGTVGYAVLLRDMLEPIVDAVVAPPEGIGGGPTIWRNASMLVVVLFVTPLSTLRNLTALKNVGAASMVSVLAVGLCVAYRSIQCQLQDISGAEHDADDTTPMQAFPSSSKELLDAVPLFISSYICHFNVLPIHNELRCPSSDRVKKWVYSSLWPATLFYWTIGFTGSLYAKCTPSGGVNGNILLDFDEKDPILLVGRLCLAMTITLAFPMLVIPARDISVRAIMSSNFGSRILRSLANGCQSAHVRSNTVNSVQDDVPISPFQDSVASVEFEPMEITQPAENLEEPLLLLENRSKASPLPGAFLEDPDFVEDMSVSSILNDNMSLHSIYNETDHRLARVFSALLVFWSAAAIACSVKSIDAVWDLLGSSFSIMMAFLIPCGAYLKLSRRKRFDGARDGGVSFRRWIFSRAIAWIMILIFAPLMVISTINAVYNSFLRE